MATTMTAFGSFAVPDIEAATQFYRDTLGMTVEPVQVEGGPVWLLGTDRARTLVYPKHDHSPAVFTVLNIEVSDIEAAVDDLGSRGVTFERYEGLETDERGILRDNGLAAAWFTDPAGNIVALVQM